MDSRAHETLAWPSEKKVNSRNNAEENTKSKMPRFVCLFGGVSILRFIIPTLNS